MEITKSFNVNISITENQTGKELAVVHNHNPEYIDKGENISLIRETVNDILEIIQEKIDILKASLPLYSPIDSMTMPMGYEIALAKATTLEKLSNRIYAKYIK